MASPSQKSHPAAPADWLQLGLGLASSNIAETSSPKEFGITQQQKQMGLGLNLNLLDLEPKGQDVCNNHAQGFPFTPHQKIMSSSHMDDLDDVNHHNRVVGVDHEWPMPVPKSSNSHEFWSSNSTGTTRPQSGLWFTLRSSSSVNVREGEADLPQIPKAYIRVKDENVTVLMVKKYLVRKLGLSNEAQIEISCMGLKLLQSLTLKQVRDQVWLPKLVDSVNSSASSTCAIEDGHLFHHTFSNHLMCLHYGTPSNFH
ncbi:hypothetical protein UlMin_029509 [Ulmus minor]